MQHRKTPLAIAIALALAPALGLGAEAASQLDTLVVEGESGSEPTTHYTSPSTRITDIQAEGISVATVEDYIKYEPSIVVRRRYIGDPNGVVGMRGANMFQTARTLVYADGLPLHYLLETQFNGAPRWGLVGADETQAVEVVYGPFSAEYSGNAMGGVINVETKLPQERQFHAEGSYFQQDYDHLGTDETYEGNREFVSYGDKYGDLSVYLFHNHLRNDSQPQSFRFGTVLAPGAATAVSGGVAGLNSTGADVVNYGSSGSEATTNDLTKLKLGYELGDWLARLTLAYENREREAKPENYLINNATGQPFWHGNATLNGQRFSVSGSNFAVSDSDRETLLTGLGLEGPLGASGWTLQADLSYFDVMTDDTRTSSRHPDDPAYNVDGTPDGTLSEYDDTGWETLDLKARTERFLGRDDMEFVTGYHYDHYSLETHGYNSEDYRARAKTTRTLSSGGDTVLQAVFGQWGWQFAPAWDVALGARYEHWRSVDGFYYKYTAPASLQDHASRSEDGFSPKFSLGLTPEGPWKYRYSLAKAYRFPIVEELFKNEFNTTGTSIADAELDPEVGIHQNLMIEREVGRGFVRLNLFREVIDHVIFNQSITLPDSTTVSSFLPIDEVTTKGVEFVLEQDRLCDTPLDLRFNVAYTDSEVTEHDANPAVEGSDFPRIPDWRAHLLLTYHFNPMWDASAGVRYAADSYGQLDNSDETDEVFGAIDSYTFVDLKANFRPSKTSRIGLGVDNVTNEEAYVAHPWPQRTVYLEGSIDF